MHLRRWNPRIGGIIRKILACTRDRKKAYGEIWVIRGKGRSRKEIPNEDLRSDFHKSKSEKEIKGITSRYGESVGSSANINKKPQVMEGVVLGAVSSLGLIIPSLEFVSCYGRERTKYTRLLGLWIRVYKWALEERRG
ncbi:Uncharacterized protein Rs2_15494 [Raphanus sativus]|nr:Uncharacterized protein Rs2_15494 [Raphanus sativus]